jgi:alanine-glyoxylate transaminase/serine-glyoxylate transaminase/serine-pyruvate transaminase
VPAGVRWDAVPKYIMEKYSVEIAGGLGPTAGKVWRIGLMGANAKPANVTIVLAALEDALHHVGFLRRSAL